MTAHRFRDLLVKETRQRNAVGLHLEGFAMVDLNAAVLQLELQAVGGRDGDSVRRCAMSRLQY
jgi:hypothetical protein